jgi:ABC-type transport system substrate-binding protein
MFDNTGYRANWFPDAKITVGSLGKLEDGIFTPYATLESQGIPVRVTESASNLSFDYSSKNGVSIDVGGGADINGGPVTDGKLTISIKFGSDDAVVFQTTGFTSKRIDNLLEIEEAILDKYRKKTWKEEWVVVTEVLHTDAATIILSHSKNSSVELSGNANAQVASYQLANTQLGLKFVKETGKITKLIGSTNIAPLYKVMGIKDPFIGKTKFTVRGLDKMLADAEPTSTPGLRELALDPRELE